MNLPVQVDQKQLMDVLLNVATVRPVFIWGAPGIGKSAIVRQFAADVGLECVSLLGSQLAPEDIIGVPQIVEGRSVFCPPRSIAREEPYCLFLDELNACSHEVQKAFYSLILERRIGEYHLPEGSIVIGAGNRAQDNAITRPMSSALVNRMFHVELTAWNGRRRTVFTGSSMITSAPARIICGHSRPRRRNLSPHPEAGKCSAIFCTATERTSRKVPYLCALMAVSLPLTLHNL